MHLADRFLGWDPDSYRNLVATDSGRDQEASAEEVNSRKVGYRELYEKVLSNDFSRRIHGLLMIEHERWYKPSRIGFEPLLFLLANESRGNTIQSIKAVWKSGGTIQDVMKTQFQLAAFRTVTTWMGMLITSCIIATLMIVVLYLGVDEASKLGARWQAIALLLALSSLVVMWKPIIDNWVRGIGRPSGFQIWECMPS